MAGDDGRPRHGAARPLIMALAVLFGLAWCAIVALVVHFGGFASGPLGWLWAALLYLPGVLVSVMAISKLIPTRHRWAVPATIDVITLVTGAVSAHFAIAGHEELRRVHEKIGVPASWTPIDELEVGTTIGFKGYPRLELKYADQAFARYTHGKICIDLRIPYADSAEYTDLGRRITGPGTRLTPVHLTVANS
ncbi:hypothetical protein CLV92_11453 [Kineococcus xinjiangensis]|uniref:Uncharacterized protein n=2 Tax=Kineococcus xinjiangensis TaxID=512762 RepID=A0A2S6IE06_9ACTN|nr:hypothetical protein CLV92_11453 [Kineococcus xinjiangensis]